MKEPGITDHALLRYLERVLDVDVQAHRLALTAHIRKAAEQKATVWFDGTFTFIFAAGSGDLVTVFEGPPNLNRSVDFPSKRIRR